MKRYRCIVMMGHMGRGKHMDVAIEVEATNIASAYNKARYYPGVKTHRKGCVRKVEEIQTCRKTNT